MSNTSSVAKVFTDGERTMPKVFTDGERTMPKVFTDGERNIILLVNLLVLTNSIGAMGVVTNIMNMVVFYKQGFSNTMNISFFGMAVADLCSLLPLLWFCVCVNPLFQNSGVAMEPSEVVHLTACFPHICCARITSWITVYITAERCLCIILPLKIKQIITPKVTTVTLFVISLVIFTTFLPVYATSYISWKAFPERNKTLLGLLFTEERGVAESATYIMYSIQGFLAFVAVIVFTVILVVQLKAKSKWRMSANEDKSQSESISNRERKTVIMVVMIATILIVCYIPGVVASVITFFEPEYSIIGQLKNAYFVMWSFAFLFEALNSSVNIFLYYNMSSKYRETFDQLFGLHSSRAALTRAANHGQQPPAPQAVPDPSGLPFSASVAVNFASYQ